MNSMAQGKSEYLRALPLWAAVVPLVTINVCYVLGVSLDHLPACIPYLSGCTSVSSTGRIAPESLVSKAGLLSSAVILAFLWLRCATFLQLGGQTPSRLTVLRVLGFLAALFLALYSVTLGLREEEYRILRRIGIDGFALSSLSCPGPVYRPVPTDADRCDAKSHTMAYRSLHCVAVARYRGGSGEVGWACQGVRPITPLRGMRLS